MRLKHAIVMGVVCLMVLGHSKISEAQDSYLVQFFDGATECTYYSEGCFDPGCGPSDGPGVLEKRSSIWHVWGEVNCPHGGLTQYDMSYVPHDVLGYCNYLDHCSPSFQTPNTWDTPESHNWEQRATRYTIIAPQPPNEGGPGICVLINDSVAQVTVDKKSIYEGCQECWFDRYQACNAIDGYFDFATCTCYSTPVLVDPEGDGFALTNLAGGVVFDLNAQGLATEVSWTAPGSDDGFLALDRNGNGVIDDGTELFGGATPQPAGAGKHGFKALAVFDQRTEGGNGDGRISPADAVFARLLVWVDANHNGFSESAEMRSAESIGVQAIDLQVHESRRRDEHGNIFRYRVKMDARRPMNRWAVDVYLATRLAGATCNAGAPTTQQQP